MHLLGSSDHVALGSDMDGGFTPADLPADINHPNRLGALRTTLLIAGWSRALINAFCADNWRGFLEGTLEPRV